MAVKLLGTMQLRNFLMLLRSFSVSKNFNNVINRRSFAKSTDSSDSGSDTGSGSCSKDDECPKNNSTPSSGPKYVHKSLKSPADVSPCIFRLFQTADEQLGPGADKCGEYKNPEYYGYHIYSYTDVLLDILKIQKIREEEARAPPPCAPEIEQSDEDENEEVCETDEDICESDEEQESEDEPDEKQKNEICAEEKSLKPVEKNESKLCMTCSFADEKWTKSRQSQITDTLESCSDDSEVAADKYECECADIDDDVSDFVNKCNKLNMKPKDTDDDEC